MKIALFGATGRTGRHVISEALRRGHSVRALVRDPARLGELADRVEVVTGDARDAAAVSAVVSGSDAVISALGPSGKDTRLHAEAAPLILAAMREHGVQRYVGVGGAGMDAPGDAKSRRDRAVSFLMQRLGGAMVGDKRAEFDVWAASDRDWTLVRAPRLLDGPATGTLEHHASTSPATTKLQRADLAAFLLDLAGSDQYARQAPLVAQRS